MTDRDTDRERRLPEELRMLGRRLDALDTDGDSMAERVLAQIITESLPTPVRTADTPGRVGLARAWARRRWRALLAVGSGLLIVLALTPPVRAAVADWFDFGGVAVHYDPTAPARAGASVPGCGTPVTVAAAGRRAGFVPVVPTALGAPAVVSVAGAPSDRSVVTLCWRENGHTVRLDEFPARLDVGFAKTMPEPPVWLVVNGNTALWFAEPYLLRFWMTDHIGERWTRAERTAGPTLLWPGGDGLTLRLEGVADRADAEAVARSAP